MKKTAIGHVPCAICPFPDAEVKEDKNNHSYIHCPDCNAQTFTRNAYRDGQLRKRMRPVSVTVTEPAANTPPVPLPTEPPVPAPQPTEPPPAPAAPARKAGWLQPVMRKTQ